MRLTGSMHRRLSFLLRTISDNVWHLSGEFSGWFLRECVFDAHRVILWDAGTFGTCEKDRVWECILLSGRRLHGVSWAILTVPATGHTKTSCTSTLPR